MPEVRAVEHEVDGRTMVGSLGVPDRRRSHRVLLRRRTRARSSLAAAQS